MGTPESGAARANSLQLLRQRVLASVREVAWTTPEDLSRLSIEAFLQGDNPARSLDSHGEVHLTGSGVADHQASVGAVAGVMSSLQSLVDAAGAVLEGVRTARGKLPAEVLRLTRLNLEAAPQAGSIRLLLKPGVSAIDEIPDQPELGAAPRDAEQLADRAMRLVMAILADGVAAGPDADSFADTVRERGPRVANSLRAFACSLVDGQFDTDLTWAQPGKRTARLHATRSDAERIASLIDGRELGATDVEIIGDVSRVADERTALVVLRDDNTSVNIARGELPLAELQPVQIHFRVAVRSVEKARMSPSGEMSFTYSAKSIEILRGGERDT